MTGDKYRASAEEFGDLINAFVSTAPHFAGISSWRSYTRTPEQFQNREVSGSVQCFEK